MRILIILIVIAAVFVVVQAKRHDCKYDATLFSCVIGKGAPAADNAPPPAPPAPPETPPAPPPAQ
jgi:hypothetical protein